MRARAGELVGGHAADARTGVLGKVHDLTRVAGDPDLVDATTPGNEQFAHRAPSLHLLTEIA